MQSQFDTKPLFIYTNDFYLLFGQIFAIISIHIQTHIGHHIFWLTLTFTKADSDGIWIYVEIYLSGKPNEMEKRDCNKWWLSHTISWYPWSSANRKWHIWRSMCWILHYFLFFSWRLLIIFITVIFNCLPVNEYAFYYMEIYVY